MIIFLISANFEVTRNIRRWHGKNEWKFSWKFYFVCPLCLSWTVFWTSLSCQDLLCFTTINQCHGLNSFYGYSSWQSVSILHVSMIKILTEILIWMLFCDVSFPCHCDETTQDSFGWGQWDLTPNILHLWHGSEKDIKIFSPKENHIPSWQFFFREWTNLHIFWTILLCMNCLLYRNNNCMIKRRYNTSLLILHIVKHTMESYRLFSGKC